MEELIQILADERIPLLSARHRNGEEPDILSWVVTSADPGTEFMAISHVWANGIGNSSGNKIQNANWT